MLLAMSLPGVRFEYPGYLVLLAVIPLLIALSFRSLAGLGRARRVLAIVARCAVVTLMVLALAGMQRTRTTDKLAVIFLLDVSDSIPDGQKATQFEFIRNAQKKMRADKDFMGVVTFNGASSVEQLPMSTLAIDRLSEPPQPDHTNIAAALRMAMALFGEDKARRVVLLSDGNENVGDALQEADHLAAAGVPVDVLPLRYAYESEVVFERLSAPATASLDETINLQMVLRSQRGATGKIRLYHNDELVDLDPSGPGAGFAVTLDPGANRFTVPTPLRDTGAHRFRAVFEPDRQDEDAITTNNEGRAFTVVAGQGKVLILTTESDAPSANLVAARLEAEKLRCEVELAGSQTIDQQRLLGYSLVILSNVPRNLLQEEAEKALAVYVRELGGGLVMIGGEESFGAGGWLGSPVEDVMPVSFDVKTKRKLPKGALVLVMHACEIESGQYWGERVAVESVKALSTRDLIGVCQYQWIGADQGYWLIPLQEVGDKAARIAQIRKMQMGDLPDLDAIMRPAVEALIARRDAAIKHMIVISDFDPSPPRDDLLKAMKDNRITCSTVAIGFGGHPIDVGKAQMIARETGGKYYSTQDPSKLPQIFIKESQVVRRPLINEIRFTPRPVATFSPIVQIAPGEGVPGLGGYVVTTAKPLAQVSLVRDTEDGQDPVLAYWQAGLGKSVAFTSGMFHRWGPDWAAWPGFGKFWAEIARWASKQGAGGAFNVTTSTQGGLGRVRIEARDKDAASLAVSGMEGTLIRPDTRTERLPLTQVGPGVFEGEFDTRDAGSYIINVSYQGAGVEGSGYVQTGLSVAYSPEHRELRANESMLEQLRERSRGRLLSFGDAETIFDRTSLPEPTTRRPIWEDLVKLMLLLFLLDVAIRRIAIHPVELWAKLRRRIAEMGGRRASAEESAATLATLKGTREGVREAIAEQRKTAEAGAPPTRPARYEPPVPDAKVTEELSKALGGATEKDQPVVARPSRKPAAQSEADYTSRLLKAKKRARDDLDQPPQ